MIFHDNKVSVTSKSVWRAIIEQHPTLVVFSSYTSETVVETCWGFKDADYPLMCARSEGESNFIMKKHVYYLVKATKDKEK